MISVTVSNLIASGSGLRYDVLEASPSEIRDTLIRWRDAHGNDLLDVRVRGEGFEMPALKWLDTARGAPGCTCGTPPFAPPEPSSDCPFHGVAAVS